MGDKKARTGNRLGILGLLVVALCWGIPGCDSEDSMEDTRPKAGIQQARREGQGEGRSRRRPGFKSEFSLSSRPAFIKFREYEEKEKRGETLTEEEKTEYLLLKDRIGEMRHGRGPGWGGRRRERPRQESLESLREIEPPQRTGPDKYRLRIEEIEKQYGPEKAEGLRDIFRRFTDGARRIREEFPDDEARRRTEIRKLGLEVAREADAYIGKLEKEKS